MNLHSEKKCLFVHVAAELPTLVRAEEHASLDGRVRVGGPRVALGLVVREPKLDNKNHPKERLNAPLMHICGQKPRM